MTGHGLQTIIEGLSVLIFVPVLFVINWKLGFVVVAMAGMIAVIYAMGATKVVLVLWYRFKN